MRTARRFQRVWIWLIATTLATPACYTLLKHPKVDLTDSEETPADRCSSCHSEEEVIAFFHPPDHPPRPPVDPNDPPWWWEHYWFFVPTGPSGPTALRGIRPDAGNGAGNPIIGGDPGGFPPGPKIIGGGTRVRDPEDKKGENHDDEIRDDRDTGGDKGNSGDKKENERPVRPTSKKGKEDG